MNQKISLQQVIPVLLVLLLIGAVGLLSQRGINPPAIQVISELTSSRAGTTSEKVFDSEQAADLSAARWQAMAKFYEKHGLLNEKGG